MPKRSAWPTSFGKNPPRVLLVEDDEAIGRLVTRVLERAGCVVVGARSCAEARAFVSTSPLWDVILVDLSLPDGSGDALIAELRQTLALVAPALVLMSGNVPSEAPEGVFAMLQKPVPLPTLMSVVKDAVLATRSQREPSTE